MKKLLNFIQRLANPIKNFFGYVLKILKLCLISFVSFLIIVAILVAFEWISQFITYDISTFTSKEKVNILLEITKIVISIIATVATTIGGIVLYLNFMVASKNLRLVNLNFRETRKKNFQDSEKSKKDFKLAQLRLVSERFTKATEQLSSDKLSARLGAIYSLENIARDHNEYHWIVIEILSAFIRESKSGDRITVDCQSALTVIGRRNINLDKDRVINLSGANLRGAVFDEYANFSKVYFNQVDLREAILDDVLLIGAVIIKSNLSGIQMQEADLTGVRLKEVNLEGAILDNSYFGSSTLNNVNFKNASLILTLFIEKSTLEDVNFEGAKLNKARFDNCTLININFQEATLIKINLSNVQLTNTSFVNRDLTGAILSGANLSNDDLENSTLCRTTMPDGSINNSGCNKHR